MGRLIRACLSLALLLLVPLGIAAAQEPQEGYKLLWSYDTGNDSVEYVSVSADGSYVAALSGFKVYLFSREGKFLWSQGSRDIAGADSFFSPLSGLSISRDGSYIAVATPVFTYSNGYPAEFVAEKVYLFNQDGKLLWSHEVGNTRVVAYPVKVSISPDGSFVVVGAHAQDTKDSDVYSKVLLFNREGELLWDYKVDRVIYGVSISSDSSYIGAASSDTAAYFFNQEGELLWSYKTEEGGYAVSLSTDGSFIAACSVEKVYFLNRKGELLWSCEGDGASISSDGSYVVVEDGRKVCFFNWEGNLLWNYEMGEYEHTRTVSLSSDGCYTVVGCGGPQEAGTSRIYFFNNEGELLCSHETNGWVQRVSMSSDGYYVAAGCWEGEVYFFMSPIVLALDIDQDGVPNDKDFAPTINNTYIYVGATAFVLVGVISASARTIVRRRRKCLVEERIEEEKNKIIKAIDKELGTNADKHRE